MAFTTRGIVYFPQFGAANTSLLDKDKKSKEHENLAIAACLNELYDMAENGLPIEGGGVKSVDFTGADAGYRPQAVFSSLADRDPDKFMAVRGMGKTIWAEDEGGNRIYSPPKALSKSVREIGETAPWHVEYLRKWFAYCLFLDADYAKTAIQSGLRVSAGLPGSIQFPAMAQQELSTIARHFCAELKDADGNWIKRGQNHLLDCAGYAWMAGNRLGWDLSAFGTITEPVVKPKPDKKSWIMQRVQNG